MNVILDLDQTLIHSVPETSPIPWSEAKTFFIPGYRVYKRPYLDEFLRHILRDPWYNVGIWSAGTRVYVHEVIAHLIPDQSKLLFVMTLDDCNEQRQKPLSKALYRINKDLADECPLRRLMHDVILIDDLPGVTGYNHLNH